jgi:hypothetical protein
MKPQNVSNADPKPSGQIGAFRKERRFTLPQLTPGEREAEREDSSAALRPVTSRVSPDECALAESGQSLPSEEPATITVTLRHPRFRLA